MRGDFTRGIGLLFRGFGWWKRRPKTMALGLIPAILVAVVLLGGLITLGIFLPSIAEAITPFADGWPDVWLTVIRIAAGTAVFGAALVLSAVTFTALTLMVGDPFYERIWRQVETDLGGNAPDAPYGFWRGVRDGLTLVLRGVLAALVAALLGFIPVVGGVLGGAVGLTLTAWLLADELASRGLAARGLTRADRRRLLRGRRALTFGFGLATQLCFLVPLGAIVTMPAAVAGATLLARELAPPAVPGAGVVGVPAR